MTKPHATDPARRLSIGEVAHLAGVTPRAVRHYHASGVLPEPERDSSGYRRYGAADVIALVRVTRLRTLGMAIPQIASRVAPDGEPLALEESLLEVAEDLDREIDRLSAVRDRLRELVTAETFDRPDDALAHELRARGLLEADRDLQSEDRDAAKLVDALHPRGMTGALEQAQGLLGDPDAVRRIGSLIQRFHTLTDESTNVDIDDLARDLAAALPRPGNAAPPIDIGVMDKLIGDRLNNGQRLLMHLLRQRLDAEHG